MIKSDRAVTCIPPTKARPSTNQIKPNTRLRVAAYARVSTDTEEQLSSYEAQVDYYTQYIQNNPDWDFIEIYTDEGISATNTKKRDGFNRMIRDALAGKIDRIITKSVSRFARNTVDTLTAVRDLKSKGVEVFFEKENIYTMDSKGELLITIMSSLAQEESRNLSENVTWGQRKRFSDGKVNMPYASFLGYKRGIDGLPEIVPKEAEIVRRIYRMFLEGATYGDITRQLMDDHILTPRKKKEWSKSTILSILSNEKYKGDALLQKKFTVDFLNKKMKINEGEVPQYYVENSHPAIVSKAVFELAQLEIQKRTEKARKSSSRHCFSSRLRCECCDGYYGSKVWHSTSQYRKTLWQCNHKFSNDEKCATPHIYETELVRICLDVQNQLISDRLLILDTCKTILDTLFQDPALLQKRTSAELAYDVAHNELADFVEANKWQLSDQTEYQKTYTALENAVKEAKAEFEQADNAVQERLARKNQIDQFIQTLSEHEDLLIDFDETLWNVTVNEVLIKPSGELIFMLKSGQQITSGLQSKL
jgi:DNA invertase Pin-like site-specific DNA recombinase